MGPGRPCDPGVRDAEHLEVFGAQAPPVFCTLNGARSLPPSPRRPMTPSRELDFIKRPNDQAPPFHGGFFSVGRAPLAEGSNPSFQAPRDRLSHRGTTWPILQSPYVVAFPGHRLPHTDECGPCLVLPRGPRRRWPGPPRCRDLPGVARAGVGPPFHTRSGPRAVHSEVEELLAFFRFSSARMCSNNGQNRGDRRKIHEAPPFRFSETTYGRDVSPRTPPELSKKTRPQTDGLWLITICRSILSGETTGGRSGSRAVTVGRITFPTPRSAGPCRTRPEQQLNRDHARLADAHTCGVGLNGCA